MPSTPHSLAVVVIASEKRMNSTFPLVVQSVLDQKPDEFVVVADFHAHGNWRHLMVPALTRTTIDALIKRDVGWAATQSENVMFLSDDHRLDPNFVQAFRDNYSNTFWGLLAPKRWCRGADGPVELNMGEREKYVAGHGGVVRREIGRILPWTAIAHHRNWDVTWSHYVQAHDAALKYAEWDLAIEDLEPEAKPWL